MSDYESWDTEKLRDAWGGLMDTIKYYESCKGVIKKHARPYARKAREVEQIIKDRGEACYWCGGVQGWYINALNEHRCMHCHRLEQHTDKKTK